MAKNYLIKNSNYIRKTFDVIMLSLKKLLSYVINNTEIFKKLFVLGRFRKIAESVG